MSHKNILLRCGIDCSQWRSENSERQGEDVKRRSAEAVMRFVPARLTASMWLTTFPTGIRRSSTGYAKGLCGMDRVDWCESCRVA